MQQISATRQKGTSRGTRRRMSTLERHARILEAVSASPTGLVLTDISKGLNLPKATAHRLTAALTEIDFLSLSNDGRKVYQIGARLVRLLHLVISPDSVVPAAHPILQALVNRFEETAFVACLRNNQVETVAMVTPNKDWRGHVHPGRIMPPHAAASAKAILAFQPQEVQRAMLAGPLPAFTDKTVTSREKIMAEYTLIRKTGIATCNGEIDPGQIAFASPVHLDNTGVIFSICLVGPTVRLTGHGRAKIAQALKDAAAEFSGSLARQLGHAFRAAAS